MMRFVASRLVSLVPFAKVALHHQPTRHEQVERAVDRRLPNGRALIAQFTGEVLSRKVSVGTEDCFGNRDPLIGNRKVVIAKVSLEGVDYVALFHQG